MKKKTRKYIIIGMSIIVLGILSFSVYQSYAYFKVNYTGDIINTNVGFFDTTSFLASELLTSPTITSVFWEGPIGRDTVEEISFTTSNFVPAGVIGSWDAGLKKNGKVMAWYTDTDANGKYEVCVGAEEGVYAPINSQRLFSNFQNLNSLDLTNLDTSRATNMGSMFSYTGNNSTIFTLNLGNKFDTSDVTNMQAMFHTTGRNSSNFTLDLGNKFDTTNVTTMRLMFYYTGYNSTIFTLDLGDKFDTSNVTTMSMMFSATGYNCPVFALNLGDKFDTSKVTDMEATFGSAGYSSTALTLNLGNKFDTSNVIYMDMMFSNTGHNSTIFTLDLGDKFDTSNVTGMWGMFQGAGYNNSNFTLNLGKKFVTSKVKEMSSMFESTGYSNPNFVLDLRTLDVSAVTYSYSTLNTGNTSHKLYASSSNISFLSGKGFTGTIINCTTSPALCP